MTVAARSWSSVQSQLRLSKKKPTLIPPLRSDIRMDEQRQHSPSLSSITDRENEPASDGGPGIPQHLPSELSISLATVPETPHGSFPHCKFPSSDHSIPTSSPNAPPPEVKRRPRITPFGITIGTPSAVGAIRKSHTVLQFATPAPVKGSPLVPQNHSLALTKVSKNDSLYRPAGS